jgi:uncharacterized protein (TIGR03000 family)
VQIRLPDPQAAVWCNGRRLSGTGLVRDFTTGPLELGKDYAYEVTAAWSEGGKIVTQEQTVSVSVGGTAIVYFGR